MTVSLPTRTVKHKQNSQRTIRCCSTNEAKRMVVTANLASENRTETDTRWLLLLDGILANVWNTYHGQPNNLHVSTPLIRAQRRTAWVWAGSSATFTNRSTLTWRAVGNPEQVQEWLVTVGRLNNWLAPVSGWEVETVGTSDNWDSDLRWVWDHPGGRPVPLKLALDAGIKFNAVVEGWHRPPYTGALRSSAEDGLIWLAVPAS